MILRLIIIIIIITIIKVKNSIEQSPREANSFSATQQLPPITEYPKYRFEITFSVLYKKNLSRNTTHDLHKLLHVSALRCHHQGVITTIVYKPTCQYMFC